MGTLRSVIFAVLTCMPLGRAAAQTWAVAGSIGASAVPGGGGSPVAAVGVRRRLGAWLEARLEARYTGKAGVGQIFVCEVGFSMPCPPGDARLDWLTLEVPVLMAVSPPHLRPLYFLAGGYAGRHLRCRSDVTQAGYVTPLPRCEQAHRQDVGLTAGAGVRFPLWRGQLEIEGRYDRGLIRSLAYDLPDVPVGPSAAAAQVTYVCSLPRSEQLPNGGLKLTSRLAALARSCF